MCGHSRHAGMDCINHPACSRQVDSSLRWNDDGGHYRHLVIPACLQQAGESRNLGSGVGMWRGSRLLPARWNDGGGHYRHLVIPAQAGIQEGGVGMWRGSRLLPARWNLPFGRLFQLSPE